jgi:soluble lytic murein transglycosylase
MRLPVIFFVVIGILLSSSSVGAVLYSYVDKSGRLHFTNVPADPKYRQVPGYAKIRRSARSARYNKFIQTAAQQYKLDPELVRAVIDVESDFDPYAVSQKGAMGLMQLMPGTAKEMRVAAPFEPQDNIMGGSRYLRQLIDLFDGDLRLALAAYNAGPTIVLAKGTIPSIPETENYVKRVLRKYGSNQRKRITSY